MPLVQAKELPLLEDIVSFTPDKEFCLNAFYRTAIDWSDEVLHQDICQDYWTEEKVKQLKEIEGLFL